MARHRSSPGQAAASSSHQLAQLSPGEVPQVLRRVSDAEAENNHLYWLENSRLGELRHIRSQALGHLLRHGGGGHFSPTSLDILHPAEFEPASGSSVAQPEFGSSSVLFQHRSSSSLNMQPTQAALNDSIAAVKRDQDAVNCRLAAAEHALREQSKKLAAEKARVANDGVHVQRAWLLAQASQLQQEQALLRSTIRSPGGSPQAWAAHLQELEQERGVLDGERDRVRELAAAAERRLGEALAMSRDHASQWQVQAAEQKAGERQREACLQERLAVYEESLQTRLAQAELFQEERAAQVVAAASERVRQAEEVTRAEALEWELREAQMKEAVASQDREAGWLLESQEMEASARLVQAEMQVRSALSAECSAELEAWKARTAAEARVRVLAKVRKAQESTAQSEATAAAQCAQEHRRLIASSEALTEARLAQARSNVEESAKAQVASIQEEWRVHEAAWAREVAAAEATKMQLYEKEEAAAQAAAEQALAAQLASQQAAQEEAAALEMKRLAAERQACQDAVAATRASHEKASAICLANFEAAHRASCEEAVVAELGDLLSVRAAREAAWTQKVNAAELRKHEAQLSAQQLEERGVQLQHDYASKLGGLLTETARLKRETQLLACRRNEALFAPQQSPSPSPLSAEIPAWYQQVGVETCVPTGSTLPARPGNPQDWLSTSASSGAGAAVGFSGYSWLDQVDSGRSMGSSGLGTSVSARGVDAWLPQRPHSPEGGPGFFGGGGSSGPSPEGTGFFAGPGCSSISGSHNGSPFESVSKPQPVPLDDSIPLVYGQAIVNIDRYGWNAVYPDGMHPAWTVLHWAASEGRGDICSQLLAARADPLLQDDQGKSPLDYVCDDGSQGNYGHARQVLSEAIEGPLSSGEPPPRESSSQSSPPPGGGSRQPPRLPVLDLAAANAAMAARAEAADASAAAEAARGDSEERPSSEDAQDLPIPPVYASAIAAVERYGWETVHGSEAEWTALHWAAAEGRAQICERLLQCRADPGQPDNLGRSALDYAHEADDEETLEVLLAAAGTDCWEEAPPGY